MLVTRPLPSAFAVSLFASEQGAESFRALSSLAIMNTDRYSLFYVVWHIIMHNEPLYYIPFTDTESDYPLCYMGWDRYILPLGCDGLVIQCQGMAAQL